MLLKGNSTADWVRQLCRSSARWQVREDEVLANNLFYVDVSEFAAELIDNLRSGRNAGDTARAFACIEQGLLDGEPATKDLIVTGVFETLQWRAYDRLDPPDAVSGWLGPRSAQAWGDLIEGWTGAGIRTIEHWKRVLVNGPYAWVEWRGPEALYRWDASATANLIAGMPKRIHTGFRPLVADELGDPDQASALGCDGRYAVRIGSGDAEEFRELVVGARLGGRRAVAVANEERLGYVGGEALQLVWPWPLGPDSPAQR